MTAPTFTNLIENHTQADGTSATTASISPTGGRLLLLAVHVKRNTTAQPPQPTISGGGMDAWDFIEDAIVDDAGSDRATIWVLRAMQASPGSGAITIDFGAVTVHDFAWSVDQSDANVDTSGSNGSGAIGNTNFANDDGASTSTPACALTINAGNSGYSAAGCQTNPPNWTVRSGWNELGQSGLGSCRLLTQYEDADTDDNVSAGHDSGRSAIVGIEIKAAAGGTVEKTGSDSAAGTDATSANTATLAGTDTGSGSDATSALAATLSGSDTGAGTDAMASTGLAGSDTATGTDATNAVSATLTGAETGAGTETGAVAAALTGTDVATGTDAGTTTADVPGSETGSGTEAGSLAAALTGTDTAAGAEASDVEVDDGTVQVSGTDSAAGTDATAALSAGLAGTDSGTASETSAVSAGLSGADTATGAETASLAATVAGSETATATDTGTVVALGESRPPTSRVIQVPARQRIIRVPAQPVDQPMPRQRIIRAS